MDRRIVFCCRWSAVLLDCVVSGCVRLRVASLAAWNFWPVRRPSEASLDTTKTHRQTTNDHNNGRQTQLLYKLGSIDWWHNELTAILRRNHTFELYPKRAPNKQDGRQPCSVWPGGFFALFGRQFIGWKSRPGSTATEAFNITTTVLWRLFTSLLEIPPFDGSQQHCCLYMDASCSNIK